MTTRTTPQQTSLRRRVRQFYRLLNQRDFGRCHRMIDPHVRAKPSSVTLFQYENALRDFLEQFGAVKVLEIDIDLHLNEPSVLYSGRDFALGKTTWADAAGQRHVFSERWVCEGRTWYTRSTGFVTPVRIAPR
jgi:hypothetical protein